MPLGIALAGRRVDAADASEPRFPLASVPLVRDRLHAFFTERPAAALVSSAACGADLVALEVAGLDVGWCCPSRQSAFGKPRWLTGRESGERSTTVSSLQSTTRATLWCSSIPATRGLLTRSLTLGYSTRRSLLRVPAPLARQSRLKWLLLLSSGKAIPGGPTTPPSSLPMRQEDWV